MGAGMPRFGAEPLIVIFNRNADSGKTPIVRTGREFVYCVEGKVAYTVDTETYVLNRATACYLRPICRITGKTWLQYLPACFWFSAQWMDVIVRRSAIL